MNMYLEIVELKADIITASGGCDDDCPCDFGCPNDFAQMADA